MAPKRFPQRCLHRLALAHHQDSRPVLLIRHCPMVADSARFRQLGALRVVGYTPRRMTVHRLSSSERAFPSFSPGGGSPREPRLGGDERAQRILDDVKGVTGAASLQIDDQSPIVLSATAGALSAGDAPADGVPIKIVASLPGDAATLLLGEIAKTGALEDDDVADRGGPNRLEAFRGRARGATADLFRHAEGRSRSRGRRGPHRLQRS